MPSLNSIMKCIQLKIECLILSFYIIDYFPTLILCSCFDNLYCLKGYINKGNLT